MSMSAEDIGRRLFQHRRARGISQKKLAKLTGLSRGTIFRVEAGEGAYWTTIETMRKALGMEHGDLDHDLVHPSESQKKTSRAQSAAYV